MAISTYAELKTAVGNWLNRSGDTVVTDRVGEFIALFEAKVARTLRTKGMESRATATLSEQYLALPDDFLEMRAIKITSTDPVTNLDFATQDYITTVWAGSETGTPGLYCIVGSEILFAPSPDGSYTVEMDYYKFSALSDSTTTNWLLTAHPDLYLYGSLAQAEAYLGNDERVPMWKAQMAEALLEVQLADQNGRWSGSPLVRRSSYAI